MSSLPMRPYSHNAPQNTGFKTRDRFMVNIVSQQPFTRYQLVQELIQQSEHLFTEVAQLCRSAQVPVRQQWLVHARRRPPPAPTCAHPRLSSWAGHPHHHPHPRTWRSRTSIPTSIPTLTLTLTFHDATSRPSSRSRRRSGSSSRRSLTCAHR